VAVTAWLAGGAVAAGLLAGCASEILPVTPAALCYAEIH
jgi:hypothetical protein